MLGPFLVLRTPFSEGSVNTTKPIVSPLSAGRCKVGFSKLDNSDFSAKNPSCGFSKLHNSDFCAKTPRCGIWKLHNSDVLYGPPYISNLKVSKNNWNGKLAE